MWWGGDEFSPRVYSTCGGVGMSYMLEFIVQVVGLE